MTRLGNIGAAAQSVLMFLLLVGVWQLIADYRLVSPVFLPSPERTVAALWRGLTEGDLPNLLWRTVQRMIYGWLLASALGVALGALIGTSRAARAYLGPTLEYLRPIPASAVMPVAIAFLGLTNGMVLGVIGFGTLWPMLLATVHGFGDIEPRLIDVSRALRLSRGAIIWKIALPNALPDILAGMRLALTIALILAVVGEMLASQDGLGLAILLAARAFRAPDLFAGIVLLGFVGYVSNMALQIAERRVLRWRQSR
ncbi:MAG TPA: ABC transporter permease [Stellaceae bacterium]|nr:ABC transporter permease [Stellaceae bacterium]